MARSTVAVNFTGNVADLQRSIGQVNGSLASIGKVAAAGFAVAGAAAAGVGIGLFKLGESFDEQFDKIRVGTGATGEALEGLEGSFKNVLKNVPASFDDAGTAIADLNTRLGLTGVPLEKLSAQFLNLSRVTETDLATNVDNITRLFGDWGISTDDQAERMDRLYRASQASGIGLEDLSTSLVQFGAPLRNLGFGLDESMALLAQFNKTGVNTETVFAGLKAGVGKLAKAGEDVPATFRRVVKEITAMGPGTESTAKAIELFGQRAGPDLADAIAGGKFELESMLDAVANGSDTIDAASRDTEDFAEKWTRLKNRVLVGLEPLARKVFDGVGKAMDRLGPIFEEVGGGIAAFAAAFQAADGEITSAGFPGFMERLAFIARGTFDAIIAKVQEWWPIVVAAFDSVVTWVREHWSEIQEVIGSVMDAVEVAVAAAQVAIDAAIVLIKESFSGLVAAGEFVLEHWDQFKYLAGVMAVAVAAHYVALGVAATVSAATQIAAWVLAKAEAARTAVAYGLHVAAMIGHWALLAAKAAIHAAAVVGSWVLTQVTAAGSTAAHLAAVAAQSGGWSALAGSAARNSSAIAASWARALGPMAAVIAGAEAINKATGNKLNPNDLSLFERLDPRKAFKGMTFDVPGVPWFDDGGVMPGPKGVHRPAMVAGGETILPTHKRGVSAGVTITIGTLQNATLTDLEQSVAFMFAARGL